MPVHEASAQFDPEFALTVGANFATLRDAEDGVGSRTSFAGGVAMKVDLVGPLSAQAEALLSRRGLAVDVNDPMGGSAEVRYGASYVDLPVLLRVDGPTLFGLVTPHAMGGGYGSLKVFEQQSSGGDGITIPVNLDGPFYNRFDAGLTGGLGAGLGVGQSRLALTVRYAYGLVDVAQTDASGAEVAPFPQQGQTSSWSVMARFGF